MEQKRIKVRLTKNSPYSNYGYYEKGDIGYIDGYVNDNAVIILENGKFAKADLRWIEAVNEEDKNVNTKLKENEGIRKAILEHIQLCTESIPDRDKFIAWLEKQGKQILANSAKTCKVEPKPNPCDGCVNRKGCINCENGELREVEQKPADKVEQKFKVEKDKWYVCTSQYCNCIEGRNYKATSDGRIIDDYGTEYDMHSDAYKWFRPWTIQDAKDGDVLCCESGWTCIFKALDNHTNTFSSYSFMDKTGWFCETGSEAHTLEKAFIKAYNGNIFPATKEQRDLLFAKMKEAGYEWDAKKKELKKIVAPIFHIGDRVRYKEHACDGVITEITDTDYICGDAKLSISTQDKLELIEQSSAWSEEDETMTTNTIIMLKEGASLHFNKKDITKAANWLKSIKDRVQPQPKQEWSEEDEKMFKRCVKTMKDAYYLDGEALYWLETRFISLRPQTTWKPSKEQMVALNYVVNLMASSERPTENDLYYNILKSLREQLKKLREE